jgi:cytochrome c biogenesis protein
MKALSRFLTSVRVAIVLLIILIAASILGTLVPQQRSPAEYLARYGQLAALLERLQITRLYHSVWYVALLGFFSLNIIVCTLARLSAKLHRALRPRFETEVRHLQAMRVKDRVKLARPLGRARSLVTAELARRRYRFREEEPAANRLLLSARKRILGIFGADVVHAGLLVILAGGIISGLAGRRANLTLTENQALPVPGASFLLRLDKFSTDLYPNGAVKDWKSRLSVIEDGRAVLEKTIEVNHPLAYRGYTFYQSGYGWDWGNPVLELRVKKKSDPAYLKDIRLHPGEEAGVEGEELEITVARFIPDFVLDENNKPASRSAEPNNPAAYIEGRRGREAAFSGWVFAKFPDFTSIHGAKETDLSFELKDVRAPEYSVIQAARDPGALGIWIGCALLMGGLFLAFYWPTREIRFILEETQEGRTEIAAGGLSAKSLEEFKSEFDNLMSGLRKAK